MALTVLTNTGTIAPNNTREFEVPVGSTLTLTFPPNSRATVTENPLFVGKTTTAGNLDQRITRVDGVPQTVTCGPYPTGANVTVDVSARSGATALFSLVSGGVVLGGGGRQAISLLSSDTAEAAAANAAAIQSAMDAGGRYVLVCDGSVANISAQLVLRYVESFDLDASRVLLRISARIGSLITTEPMESAGTPVTLTWSAGPPTATGMQATVNWPAHPFVEGEHAWLNRADQYQFCGVFRVVSVTGPDAFVVQLMEIPTTAPTGPIVGRKALERVYLQNLEIDYNFSVNTAINAMNLIAVRLFGIYDLRVKAVHGRDLGKFVIGSGALAKYKFEEIGGDSTNSDVLKVYGPAFGGSVNGVHASYSRDDHFSCQTREPALFADYDVCHGSVLGLEVQNIYGISGTGSMLMYASPFGTIDGVRYVNSVTSMAVTLPHIRIETVWTTGVSEVGSVTLESNVASDTRLFAQLGNGAGQLRIRCLNIKSPNMRSSTATGRLVTVNGTNVTGTVLVDGGYINALDNIVNNGSNNGRMTFVMNGTRVGGTFNTFRAGSVGRLDVVLLGVTFEAGLGTTTFSAAAGAGILTFSSVGTTNVTGGAATYSMGAGSLLRLGGTTDIPLDGTQLDATVANHAPGASFYNTAAGFGAGVGQYVRGATAWVRTAA